MKNKSRIFQKYPWLALVLLNVLLVGGTCLVLVIGVGVAVSESYHPDAVHRPLTPTMFALFIPSALILLASLLAWFKWRRVTGKKIGITLLLYVLVLGVSGTTTFFLTDTNPESYT